MGATWDACPYVDLADLIASGAVCPDCLGAGALEGRHGERRPCPRCARSWQVTP